MLPLPQWQCQDGARGVRSVLRPARRARGGRVQVLPGGVVPRQRQQPRRARVRHLLVKHVPEQHGRHVLSALHPVPTQHVPSHSLHRSE